MLERSHLAIVQQVDQQGSLTAAAGVLCLTQSALSHSMKKLEQQLGTAIWLREGRTLRLTRGSAGIKPEITHKRFAHMKPASYAALHASARPPGNASPAVLMRLPTRPF